MLFRLILGAGSAIACLFLGKWLRQAGFLNQSRSQQIIRLLVQFIVPVTLWLSLWNIKFSGRNSWSLPLIGFFMLLAPIPVAWAYARWRRLSRPEKGSFLTCATFSNVGYFGSFVAFAVFGEEAYALCVFYMTLFNPGFYTLGFWLAARYGDTQPNALANSLKSLRWLPLYGMMAGLSLHLLRIPRPEILGQLNQWLIPVMTVGYLTAIGSELTFRVPARTYPHCAAMCGIKFLYLPAVAWWVSGIVGLSGLERMVVILEAATPVAVSPLIFPMLFGMDRRLSSALWFSTTMVALPWFLFWLPGLAQRFGV